MSEDEFSFELKIKAKSIKTALFTILLISFLGTIFTLAFVLYPFHH